jgi:hypothetical protein
VPPAPDEKIVIYAVPNQIQSGLDLALPCAVQGTWKESRCSRCLEEPIARRMPDAVDQTGRVTRSSKNRKRPALGDLSNNRSVRAKQAAKGKAVCQLIRSCVLKY